jgi:hypothetical protein
MFKDFTGGASRKEIEDRNNKIYNLEKKFKNATKHVIDKKFITLLKKSNENEFNKFLNDFDDAILNKDHEFLSDLMNEGVGEKYIKKNKPKEYKRINCDLKDKKFFRRGTPMECAKVGKFNYYGKIGMEKNDEINEALLKIAEASVKQRVRKQAKKVISEKTNAPPEAVEEMVNEILG